MRQRVVIALALCAEPKLIVADEPTTALDVSIQAQVIALLKRLAREKGTAMMLVTHDMGVIAETADRVAVMYAGRIAEIGPVREVVKHAAHPYTRRADGLDPADRPPGGAAAADRGRDAAALRHPARLRLQPALPAGLRPLPRSSGPSCCAAGDTRAACWLYDAGSEQARCRRPMRPCLSTTPARRCSRRSDAGAASSTSPARCCSALLAREARRMLRAVDGVSFAIPKGTTLSLVGESGCGKSTVARLVVGLYRADARAGAVRRAGPGAGARRRRRSGGACR